MKWWSFFMLKVIMARGRILKKGGVEVHKQNVASSYQTIAKEIVVSLDQAITHQIVPSLN
jgi:radical SAM superfamily enzyme with C-terminal helix-hairpin-helix motif